MVMNYGSPVYLYIAAFCAFVCFACYFIPKHRSERYKTVFCLILALVNVLQHVTKHLLYPHLRGTAFGLTNTAYNVCAAIILLTPFALLTQKGFFRLFVSYVGTVGGAGALLLPVWFIGRSILDWEYFRFWFCHILLLLTSLLPILWGMRKPRYTDFWKTAPAFLALLGAILLNDAIVVCCSQGFVPEALYATLYDLNPFGIMHPMGNFGLLDEVCAALTPARFLPSDTHPYYTPLLWCALPIALLITLCSLLLFTVLDRKHFLTDWNNLFPRQSRAGQKDK